MKDPRTKGVFVVAHNIEVFDQSLLWELKTLWNAPFMNDYGEQMDETEVRAEVKEVSEGAHGGVLGISPPFLPTDQPGDRPWYKFFLKPWRASVLTPVPDEDKGIKTDEATVEWAIFSAARMRYSLLAASGGSNVAGNARLHEREGSDRFLDACKRVRDVLHGHFAFGGADEEFIEPGLEDPRVRAWGVTYYGSALVEELGRDRLQETPAYQVEFDKEGGCWVQLVELPFLTSPRKERVREKVEAHLGLRERFPNE